MAHFLYEFSSFDDAVASCEFLKFGKQVRGYEDSHAVVFVEFLQKFSDFEDSRRVETVYGFVENENARIAHECDGDCETLLHTERIVFDFCGVARVETDFVKNIFEFFLVGYSERIPHRLHIFKGSEMSRKGRGIHDGTDFFALVRECVRARSAVDSDFAARGVCKTQKDSDKRCFACAVSSDKTVYVSLANGDAHVVEYDFVFAVLFCQV